MENRKEIKVKMGIEIKKAREAAGLTQDELGGLISMGSKNISDVERGVVGISFETLKRICETLHVSSDRILFGERNTNDVDFLLERLSLLSPEEFVTVVDFINKLLETMAKQHK